MLIPGERRHRSERSFLAIDWRTILIHWWEEEVV